MEPIVNPRGAKGPKWASHPNKRAIFCLADRDIEALKQAAAKKKLESWRFIDLNLKEITPQFGKGRRSAQDPLDKIEGPNPHALRKDITFPYVDQVGFIRQKLYGFQHLCW